MSNRSRPAERTKLTTWFILLIVASLAVALPEGASAENKDSGKPSLSKGSLVQMPGKRGCLVQRSKFRSSCASARAIRGPGPFMGSRAIEISPDGRNVYVASSGSNAIAIFTRNRRSGVLSQEAGVAGCVAVKGGGCRPAVGLRGPNSLAVSPDGRNVYATSRNSGSITAFKRNGSTGALKQLSSGCFSGLAVPGCQPGRALDGPDVVTISPDGDNVYVGSFFGNSLAVFDRKASGALSQPTDETGCITNVPTTGCAQGLALASPEGMAVSGDGKNVYVATAVSNAVLDFARDTSTGVLTQATDGSGCIVEGTLTDCTAGTQISGANAVAISPGDDDVYVTSLVSSSLTSFSRSSGSIFQLPGKTGCVVWLGGGGCTPGRALRAPEGLALSPDGSNVYVTAFSSGSVAVMNRDRRTGTVVQKTGAGGCLTIQSIAKCQRGRMLAGASSVVVSKNGRHVYATAFNSDAIAVFRRVSGR
ncbi:MAG: lactonase family protein [Solirubrobacterales bacterium]